MKREILFKAKRVDGRGWVFGNLVVEMKGVSIISFNSVKYMVFPETVCQFTGLLDKNGNKIFEGDKVNVSPLTKSGRIEIVKHLYAGGFLSIHPFQSDGFHWSSLESEITGNIYDK